MKSAEKKVIGILYILHTKEGEFLEETEQDSPLEILLGTDSIIPGLEKELIGLSIGDKKVINIEPEDAYGEDRPELRIIMSKSDLPKDFECEPGVEFLSEDDDGEELVFVVVEVEGDDVKVDGNHPLAGESLKFEIEVVSLREPTEDELTHGHVHGEDCVH